MRAGLGISTLIEPRAAAREAASLALSRMDGGAADLALVVASAAHGESLSRIAAEAADVLGSDPVVGASVEGIVAAGVEVSAWPATLVLAVAGADATPFLLRDAAGGEVHLGEDIAALAGGPLGERDLVVLLPDPLSLDLRSLLAGLPDALRPATILGASAAPLPRGRGLSWCGREVASDGLAGFVLRDASPRIAIAQAGCPVTPALTVTRSRGSWVTGLDGRPALDVYDEARARFPGAVGTDGGTQLLVGLLPSSASAAGADPTASDAIVVRRVVGRDSERRAFSIPEAIHPGQRLVFVRLDAAVARRTLADQLEKLAAQAPVFGLYFNCRARGASLFGEAGVEATLIANSFAQCPVAGISGSLQLAPLCAPSDPTTPAILTYAGVLAAIG